MKKLLLLLNLAILCSCGGGDTSFVDEGKVSSSTTESVSPTSVSISVSQDTSTTSGGENTSYSSSVELGWH